MRKMTSSSGFQPYCDLILVREGMRERNKPLKDSVEEQGELSADAVLDQLLILSKRGE